MNATLDPPKSLPIPIQTSDVPQAILDAMALGDITLEQLQRMHEDIPPFLHGIFVEHMLFPQMPKIFSEHLRLLELEFDAEHYVTAFTLRFEDGRRLSISHCGTHIETKLPMILLSWEIHKEEE